MRVHYGLFIGWAIFSMLKRVSNLFLIRVLDEYTPEDESCVENQLCREKMCK